MSATSAVAWPELDLAKWADTRDTLHLWTQIVGKVRLAQTPWINHSWHCSLYVTSRGLSTLPIPYGERIFQIDFDFIDQAVIVTTVDGERETIMLRPRTVASFYQELMGILKDLELPVAIHTHASELPETIDLSQDVAHEAYDPESATRFWRALASCHRVFRQFRSRFLGKASPVHFFWGSFDLALALYSGRPAPPSEHAPPHMPKWVAEDASNREQACFGFWPGNVGGPVAEAAFYAYAHPAPDGYSETRMRNPAARFPAEMGEWILPYDVVRNAKDPDAEILTFLEDTYAAAADLGGWDRKSLERIEELPPPK